MYKYLQRFSNEELPEWLTEDMLLDMDDSDRLFMKLLFFGGYITQISGGINNLLTVTNLLQKN